MSKLPQEYINFIAKGIVYNLKLEGIPEKENYTEEDLIDIFQCKDKESLYLKIEEIESKTIQALGLADKEFYTQEELEDKLNLAPGMIHSMENALDEYPEHSK